MSAARFGGLKEKSGSFHRTFTSLKQAAPLEMTGVAESFIRESTGIISILTTTADGAAPIISRRGFLSGRINGRNTAANRKRVYIGFSIC